ncbi:MAG: PilT/PilU family type 4a pilus ATPase [Candidatus Pacebacteria bacterium]|jgi:twitching motility protein PilT|nr:PilT/PilU family type 4a pilus ATPase [Candidatus Paceibacterota bacterium]
MSKYKEKLDQILNFAIDQKASDVHIAVGRPLIIRINSVLVFTNTENFIKEDLLGIIDVLLTFYQQEKFTKDKSINFSYSFQNRGRFRINIFFQKKNISIALRYISNEIKSFDELKLPKELKSIASFKQGLVLITGPTGQGKSTTLAAIINEINNIRNSHIITIEDPIEFIFKDNKSIISQREVFEDTHSFNDALEDTFRQDPDVIMVGEMRDYETIATAMTAAETGHLVLGTLHTNSAAQTIDRIIDSFPAGQQNQIKSQLALCLSCIFSQRLIPKINSELTVAYELMHVNTAIANLIREGAVHRIPAIIATSRKEDMISLNHCLSKMVVGGEITLETAFKTSLDIAELKMLLG